MIISRTPFRMSFFGGGTDYPAWYREHGGAVLTTSIDKYCYITCRRLPPFFDHHSRVLYSKIELVQRNEDIEHPAVRACLKHMGIDYGVEVHHDGDLPARTGLGSSSAFAVGLLHALFALKDRMVGKMELALQAIHIEQEALKETVGCQDQMIAALGGLQRIDFRRDGQIVPAPVLLPRARYDSLQDHCLLYYTGLSRTSSEIAQEQLRRMPERGKQLSRMGEMVDEGLSILTGQGDLAEFGRLLDESWRLKRSLSSKVSSEFIDGIYEEAKAAGALGGKLLGAGGGGFLMLFARPEDQPKVKERLKKLLRIPFRFENEGSQIIFFRRDAAENGAGH